MVVLVIQFLFFVSLFLSVYMIFAALERCRSEKRYSFVYFIAALFLYSLGCFVEINCGNLEGGIFAVKIMYAGAAFVSPFFFFLVADYCELHLPKKYYRIPMLIIPALFYALVLSFESHQMLYLNFDYDPFKPVMGIVFEPGPFYQLGIFYPLFCIALSCIVLVRGIVTQSRRRRKGLVLLLVFSLLPLLANFLYATLSFFFNPLMTDGTNLTVFVMIILNFVFYLTVVRNDRFDFTIKAQTAAIEMMNDAFVVLDGSMAYVGSNKKAEELFPFLSEFPKGVSILELKNWPANFLNFQNFTAASQGGTIAPAASHEAPPEKEMKFSLPHKPGKYYSGRVNCLVFETGRIQGWAIRIQDISDAVLLARNVQVQEGELAAVWNNLEEGVFLMNREYRIQDSYSKAMERVLASRNLRGRKFTDLLSASYDPMEMKKITDYFNTIMNKPSDRSLPDSLNPLKEFSYTSTETGERKNLRCRFSTLEQGNGEIFILGIIHDLSGTSEGSGVFIDGLEKICKKICADEQKQADLKVKVFAREAFKFGPRFIMGEILTQLLRYSIHHGMETPKERLALGKSETGQISLSITVEKKIIRMVLADDGCGLDFEKIAQTEDVNANNEVSLKPVKEKLLQVKGSIRVQAKKGRGLVFIIQIPLGGNTYA